MLPLLTGFLCHREALLKLELKDCHLALELEITLALHHLRVGLAVLRLDVGLGLYGLDLGAALIGLRVQLRLMPGGIDGDIQEPLAFLFRMANNLWLNRRRALSRREAREDAWQGLNPQMTGEADASPDAEARLGARQTLRAVLKDIDALPPRTRDIFRLHKLEGLSQTEVARRLDISLSSVEKHLSSALKHLLALNRSRRLN